jgi:hypothetical protein
MNKIKIIQELNQDRLSEESKVELIKLLEAGKDDEFWKMLIKLLGITGLKEIIEHYFK